MAKYDILVKNGLLVDPANDRLGVFDIGIKDGRVVTVASNLSDDSASTYYNASGKLLLPGLVDTHVHLTPAAVRGVGLRMLALGGVTCALDCAGPVEEVIKGMAQMGSGISVAVLNRLDPGITISGPDAGKPELMDYLDTSLQRGAIGFKILGGHLPLSPETTTAAIDMCNREGAYVAFHCGSTLNGSNLNGLRDSFDFAGTNRVHICHVNAYCRGLTHGSPLAEIQMALEDLSARRQFISESHLGPFNCAWARLENNIPRSHVTRTCLNMGGFEADKNGLLEAARKGYMLALKPVARSVIYVKGDEAATYLEENNFDIMVSFPVNLRSTAFLAATEKNKNKKFIVTAISTDGGGIPRNFLLSHGLSLVRFEALTLPEFVQKCAWHPAKMLGLHQKGHLGTGADADLVVADPDTHQALLTVAEGKVIMVNGIVTGTGGTLITTDRYKPESNATGIIHLTTDLAGSLLYEKRFEKSLPSCSH